jgi:hypothetical protein
MSASTLFLGSMIAGAGFGLIIPQIVNLILSTVREDEVSEATGVNSTGEQLGNAIGVALIGSIMLNTLNSALARNVTASNTLTAEVKSAVLSAAEKDIPLLSGSDVQELLAGVDAVTQQELLSIYSDSYLTAFSAAMLFLALMAGIGYFVARRLPSTRLVEEEPVVADQG